MATDELLTKDEMDALMEGVAKGRLGVGDWPEAADEEILPYELVSPENVLTGIVPVLETINERFAHQMNAGLFELLRRSVDVAIGAVETRPYNDLVTSLAAPCSANVIRMAPLAGPGLLVFEQQLVFMVVDTFFGGRGKVYTSATVRDFTATEKRLIRRLLNLVFNALAGAWEPFVTVQCGHVEAEINPQFITAINPGECLAVTTLTVTIEEVGGALHLALPCSMFEPVRKTLLNSLLREHPAHSNRLTRLLREGVKDSRVELRGVLAEIDLSLRELLTLSAGDVIPVDIPDEAVLEAEGVAVYSGHYGVARGCQALKIRHTLTPLSLGGQDPSQSSEETNP